MGAVAALGILSDRRVAAAAGQRRAEKAAALSERGRRPAPAGA
jgi:hypothetical protein